MISRISPEYLPKQSRAIETRAGLHPVSTPGKRAHLHLVTSEGQLQVHTAPFRGSFSGVLSEALRAAGLGSRVIVAQFLKGGVSQGPEGAVQLCGRLKWLRPSISCCLVENAKEKSCIENKSNERNAVREIWQVCKENILEGIIDQLVLDEVGLAIALGYLKEDDLITTLEQRPDAMDVILTGPAIPPRIMSMADQVTELRSGH
ncbi:cob(I)yrinic acid a,c-diamide adenosyltransferase [Prochlorococcus sp. MIT 1307]|uniref:cob(I)yrinic acid a,c-diamide adenosyltransferase n=1 Tax=Prochlorococcus sp. MIT 1307 TaxID=3096219 RepID=UPI002A75BA77|nr:cob(I)yrinic acid a,c-diamide adenosyltransferase [Prochlorococcus sp. MIT 1307]